MPPFKSEHLEHPGKRRQAGLQLSLPRVEYNGDRPDAPTMNWWTIGGRVHRVTKVVKVVKTAISWKSFV